MPSPDPSASLAPFERWAVDAAAYGSQQLAGIGVLIILVGIVVVFLLAILAVNVFRP